MPAALAGALLPLLLPTLLSVWMIPRPFTRIILSLQIPLPCSLSLPRANTHVFPLTSAGRGRALSRSRSPILLQFWVSTSAPTPLASYLPLGFLFGAGGLSSSLLFPQVPQSRSCQGLCPCGAGAHHPAERHDRSISVPGGSRAWSLHAACPAASCRALESCSWAQRISGTPRVCPSYVCPLPSPTS